MSNPEIKKYPDKYGRGLSKQTYYPECANDLLAAPGINSTLTCIKYYIQSKNF